MLSGVVGAGWGWAGGSAGALASTRKVIVIVAALPAPSYAFTIAVCGPAVQGPARLDSEPIIREAPPSTQTSWPAIPDSASNAVQARDASGRSSTSLVAV